jgi:capsular polysaccharide biosynthesis protein
LDVVTKSTLKKEPGSGVSPRNLASILSRAAFLAGVFIKMSICVLRAAADLALYGFAEPFTKARLSQGPL